ncbi:hypothetical protein [Streptomyces sp. NPDC056512]|uniref:hypothetical protein n=1 Tax=Streptomyces sp. NPDC056512 TaxID=3345846 RepID=UPI0036B1B6D7
MSQQHPSRKTTSWAYVVLAVLLAAIGNGWEPDDVRALGYVLVAVVTIAYASQRGSD